MKVTVTAIAPFNSYKPGEVFDLTEREALHAEQKGLVKMRGPVSNKMQVEPENKKNPTSADGVTAPSSASPAARASRQTTARPSARGGQRVRPPAKR